MNECIVHFDGPSPYDDPLFVTERTLTTILFAKEEHEKRNERHIFKWKYFEVKVSQKSILFQVYKNYSPKAS